MFKTILKIAVLSATTITLLSACGAATKALNDALKDFENRARGANTQINNGDNGNPILTASTTAEICSDVFVADLWVSPCDNDEASIQKFHEFCVNNLFHWGCAGDDRYNDVRIKFCNNPANAGHDACFAPLEPQVDSDRYTSPGYIQNQFLQGTADGLNTGSLHTSLSDATAPVVHILKLSDSDDGVAFFSGIAPVLDEKQFAPGWKYYYAGILPDPNLGAPITQTSGTAAWQGTFSVITSVSYVSDVFRTDKDFELQIDFATQQLSASINGVKNKDKNNQLEPNRIWTHSDYRLSGIFSDGKIEGVLYATRVVEDNGGQEINWGLISSARVQGLIGQDGAVAAFVADDNPFSGGFVARP